MKNVLIRENRLENNNTPNFPFIYVNANTNNIPSSMQNVIIENNSISGGIRAKSDLGGSGNIIRNNVSNNNGSLQYSCNITVQNNIGFTLENCSRTKSSNELP